MKIAIIGTRGIPANYGGFETFAEKLSIGLRDNFNAEVLVICDKGQGEAFDYVGSYQGVQLDYSKYDKPKNPNLYYMESIFKSKEADVIFSCGVGGAFMVWLPKLMGKRFAVNPDGLEWKREKWSKPIRFALKLMFGVTARFSQHIVCDSKGVAEVLKEEFNRTKRVEVIEYGAYKSKYLDAPIQTTTISDTLKQYELQAGGYHLVVARLEPENNVELIIKGYELSEKQYPMVVIGNLLDTDYVKQLQKIAGPKVRFLGGVYNGDDLEIIRTQALAYYHGHSVGGTNPSLLEAMGAANLCVCHDNRFNREVVSTENGFFFSTAEELQPMIDLIESGPESDQIKKMKEGVLNRILNYYNWESITERYYEYFQKISS